MKNILLSLLVILAAPHLTAQNWITGTGPFGGDVRALNVIDNDVVLLRSMGGLYRSTDYGERWNRVFNGFSALMRSRSGVLIGCSSSQMARSTDNGLTWTSKMITDNSVVGFAQNSRNEVFAVATLTYSVQPVLWKSTDDGISWSTLTLPDLPGDRGQAIAIDNLDNIYVATYGPDKIRPIMIGKVLRSSDNGQTWVSVVDSETWNLGIIYKLIPVSNGDLYACSLTGLRRSRDRGATWQLLKTGWCMDATIENNGQIWCAFDADGINVSEDSGATWTKKSDGIRSIQLYAIARTSNGYLIAGTGSIGIYVSKDNGKTWVEKNQGFDALTVNSFFISKEDIVYAVCAKGVAISKDKGLTWVDTVYTTQQNAGGAYGINEDSRGNLYAGTGTGVLKSTDRGISWTLHSQGFYTGPVVFALVVDRHDNIYAATQNTGICKSVDYGLTWKQVYEGGGAFHSLAVDSKGSVHAASWSGAVMKSSDDGTSWTSMSDGLPSHRINHITIDSQDNFFVATENVTSTFHYGQGVYWKPNDSRTWRVLDTVALARTQALCVNSQDNLFAGVQGTINKVFQSSDLGRSWKETEGFADAGIELRMNGSAIDHQGYLYVATNTGIRRTAKPTFGPPVSPRLTIPCLSATGVDPLPVAKWDPSPGASYYSVQVSGSHSFSTTLLDSAVYASSLQMPRLVLRQQYYWRGKAVNNYGESNWSSTQSFVVRAFDYCAKTGNNAHVAIPVTANLKVGTQSFQIGDEIGAFTAKGLCVGSGVWEGKDLVLTIWGDDDQTTEVDGMKAAEEIRYKIFRASTKAFHDVTVATYAQGDGKYVANGLFTISAMNATMTDVTIADPELPTQYTLSPNYPNPFNPRTTIRFGIPKTSHVSLKILNILGEEVVTLVNEQKEAGNYQVGWSSTQSTGIYFYRLHARPINGSAAAEFLETKKMTLLR